MNDPDNFLGRWSRRKQEAKADPAGDTRHLGQTPSQDEAGAPGRPSTSEPSRQPQPDLNTDSLPPVDSIGPDSDISAFMREGVPDSLRHAALRRVWSADPAIRDFIGPNENFWDAAGPDGVPGFGPLDPGLDVKRMVAELFGEIAPEEQAKPEASGSGGVSVGSTEIHETRAEGRPVLDEQSAAKEYLPHPAENVATQNPPAEPQTKRKTARRHGGAMPQEISED